MIEANTSFTGESTSTSTESLLARIDSRPVSAAWNRDAQAATAFGEPDIGYPEVFGQVAHRFRPDQLIEIFAGKGERLFVVFSHSGVGSEVEPPDARSRRRT